MKRSEQIAWSSLVGLLGIAVILLIGGYDYDTTPFWAGMILVLAQALPVGFAAWGLRLARQREELTEVPINEAAEMGQSLANFRMTAEQDITPRAAAEEDATAEVKTLDTAFQRTLVAITAVVFLALAAVIGYLVNQTFSWAQANPDKPFPIAGSFAKPLTLDNLGLVIGLAAAAIYCVLYALSRPKKFEDADAAVAGNFTLGIAGMVGVGIATVAACFNVPYVAEIAGVLIAALLALQGVEFLVNSFRTYAGVEEMDQEAVDLNALPLVPLLSSSWLASVRMLFAQSVGLSDQGAGRESGVIARMMPRALLALLVLAIFISCFRVVRPGDVAVRERLGYAKETVAANGRRQLDPAAIYYPGLHMMLPWPIDRLVVIPTQRVQTTDVGAQLHAPPSAAGKTVDFQFWTIRAANVTEKENSEDQFVTGDPAPQMLETYVVVLWRVKDPAQFYLSLSHSSFFNKSKGETTALPIYDAMVQEEASYAVTQTFANHTLDDIMTTGRSEVEAHCKKILQDKLNESGLNGGGSGIEVVDLTIKDLHPPLGRGTEADPSNPDDPFKRGPAAAYENVTSKREFRDTLNDLGEAQKITAIALAQGDAAAQKSQAEEYSFKKIAQAQGEAARLKATLAGFDAMKPAEENFMNNLAERQAMYRTLKDVFTPVSKILVDPRVKDISLYQASKDANAPRPPGQEGAARRAPHGLAVLQGLVCEEFLFRKFPRKEI